MRLSASVLKLLLHDGVEAEVVSDKELPLFPITQLVLVYFITYSSGYVFSSISTPQFIQAKLLTCDFVVTKSTFKTTKFSSFQPSLFDRSLKLLLPQCRSHRYVCATVQFILPPIRHSIPSKNLLGTAMLYLNNYRLHLPTPHRPMTHFLEK